MGYVFLWLEAMASALLMVAVVFAFSGRLKKWPALWPILMSLLLTLPALAATVFAGYLFFENIHPQWLFPYMFSWTLLYVTGSWILIRWGRRIFGATPVASTWHRLRLSGFLVIALALQWSTMTTLDNTAKLEAVAIQTMALTKARTVLPSSPPYDQNAAEFYDQAAIMSKQNQGMEEDQGKVLENSTNPAFDINSEPAQKLLRENIENIDLIKNAAQKPYLYHPYTIDNESIEFPSIYLFREATQLLALKARTHSRNGHTVDALENIFIIDRIAQQVYQTPLLANVLVAGSIQNRSKSVLEIILSEKPAHVKIKIPLPVKIHDHILQVFKDSMVFEEAFITFGWAKTVIEDEPLELLDLESVDLFGPEDSLRTRMSGYLYRAFLFQDDQVAEKASWEKIHESIQNTYYDSGMELKEWEENKNDHIEVGFYTSRPTFTVSSYFERVTQQQTQFLLGRLGLAAASYHSDHGKYPATLDALVPKYITEIPIDPFNGEPIKMIAVKGGLILYSVAQDLKDDHGVAFDRETDEGDLAFYLGSAFKKYRLQPAIEESTKRDSK